MDDLFESSHGDVRVLSVVEPELELVKASL